MSKLSLSQIPLRIKWGHWPSHSRSLRLTHSLLWLWDAKFIFWSSSSTWYKVYTPVFRKHCQVILLVVKHTRRSLCFRWFIPFILSLFKLDSIWLYNCRDCMILRHSLLIFLILLICRINECWLLIWLFIFIIHQFLELLWHPCLRAEQHRSLLHA